MVYESSSSSKSPDDGPTTLRRSARAFDAVSSVNVEELPDIVEEHRSRSIDHIIDTRIGDYDDFYKLLVAEGHADIKSVIEQHLLRAAGSASVDIDTRFERQLAFVNHPKTTLSLGVLAARNESFMDSIIAISRSAPKSYDPHLKYVDDNDTGPHLIARNMSFRPEPGVGCPFASPESDAMPTLPFRRFAQFASRLIILEEMARREGVVPRLKSDFVGS